MTQYSNQRKRRSRSSEVAEDRFYLKKASKRIRSSLVMAYTMLCLWPLAMYFVLAQPLFAKPSYFNMLYLLVLFVELAVWLLIFFAASGAKKFSKYLFTLSIWCEFGFAGWLLYDTFRHLIFLPFYMAWILLALIKDFFLIWYKRWLYDSWWGTIFFDHVLVLSEEDRRRSERQRAQRENASHQSKNRIDMPLNQARRPQYADEQAMYMQNRARKTQPQQPYVQHDPYGQNAPARSSRPSSPAPAPSSPAMPSYRQAHGDTLIASGQSQHTQQRRSNPQGSYSTHDAAAQRGNSASARPARLGTGTPDFRSDPVRAEQTRLEREKEARRKLSSKYPRAALRMAVGIYGELIIFPIVTHMMQNSFVSTDNSSVFAVGLMFTLCILTAVLWTFPIFFYYLKYPGAKKSLWAALAGQLGILAYGVLTLRSYSLSETVTWPSNVFLLFSIFELVRYAILAITVIPVFRLPEIRDEFGDSQSSPKSKKKWFSRSDDDLDLSDDMHFVLEEEQDEDEGYDEYSENPLDAYDSAQNTGYGDSSYGSEAYDQSDAYSQNDVYDSSDSYEDDEYDDEDGDGGLVEAFTSMTKRLRRHR